MRRVPVLARWAFAGALALSMYAVAFAQTIDPKRPRTLVVGSPKGASPLTRVDPRRSGFSEGLLPRGSIRVAWRTSINGKIEQAPVVSEAGEISVVTARGEVVALDGDGNEKWRGPLIPGIEAGPLAVLAGGTFVFGSSNGEVLGVRNGALRFRTRAFAPSTLGATAPLPLVDGGFALASGGEIGTFDSEGSVRARTSIPDASFAYPLIQTNGRIVAVTLAGDVFGWFPGRDVLRIGALGSPLDTVRDEGPALLDSRTLVGVTSKGWLVEIDLESGKSIARAAPSSGLLLGPPSVDKDRVHVLLATPGRTYAVSFDRTGQETRRIGLVTVPIAKFADGGAAPFAIDAHVGTLVDRDGTIAFATPDGTVGTASDSAIDVLGQAPCGSPTTSGAGVFAGIAPFADGAFVLACGNGGVAKVDAPPSKPSL